MGSDSIYLTEVFGPTLQGEGILAGTMTSFVRTAGCTVGCKTCDTVHSWPFGSHPKKMHPLMRIADVLVVVDSHRTKYVVVTGGEPLESEDMEAFCVLLGGLQYELCLHTTVETSGSVAVSTAWIDRLMDKVDLWSFSPKVSSMRPVKPPIPDFIAQVLKHPDRAQGQLKFVVDPAQPKAFEEVGELLRQLTDLGCPKVPLLLQVLTKRSGNPQIEPVVQQILADQRRLFEATHALKADWGLWHPQDARISCQTHVLTGVR